MAEKKKEKLWIYILELVNGYYYTGYTKDLERRYFEHKTRHPNSKYTRSFPPVKIVQCWSFFETVGTALKIERIIKKKSRKCKESLIETPSKLNDMVLKELKIDIEITNINPVEIENKVHNKLHSMRNKMKKYSQTLNVRSYELDVQGHVNYAVYLNYLEFCRVYTLEQLGAPFQDYIKKGIYIVIAEINIKYRAPAFLGDELEITLEGIKLGKTSCTFKQEIFNMQNKKKLLEATLTAVFISKAGKPVKMDDKFRKLFF